MKDRKGFLKLKEMQGKILAVNISQRKGGKAEYRPRCFIENLGLDGDAHAESGIRQVSLLAKESIDKLRAKGLDVQYGDFAENLATEGIDPPPRRNETQSWIGSPS